MPSEPPPGFTGHLLEVSAGVVGLGLGYYVIDRLDVESVWAMLLIEVATVVLGVLAVALAFAAVGWAGRHVVARKPSRPTTGRLDGLP